MKECAQQLQAAVERSKASGQQLQKQNIFNAVGLTQLGRKFIQQNIHHRPQLS